MGQPEQKQDTKKRIMTGHKTCETPFVELNLIWKSLACRRFLTASLHEHNYHLNNHFNNFGQFATLPIIESCHNGHTSKPTIAEKCNA